MEERMNTDGLNEATSNVRRLIERMRERMREQTEVLDNLSFYMEKTEELQRANERQEAEIEQLRQLLQEEKDKVTRLEMQLNEMGKMTASVAGKASEEEVQKALRVFVNKSKRKKLEKRIAVKEMVLELANANGLVLPEDLAATIDCLDDEELAETLPAGGAVTDNLAELLTAEAQVLWQRLRDAGFIVAGGYALAEGVSANQAAYIADRMAERLHIRKKWKLFQQLWGIPNLAQLAGTWQQTGKLPPRSGEIDRLLK
jgi:predicted RNase H-like nuclease (RuvC/YqgF family)